MIVLGGTVYQVRADGRARVAEASVRTPFAVVTPFDADITADISTPTTCGELERFLDALLPSRNLFYAFRIEGHFRSLTARSEARQTPPYPTLAQVLEHQVVFDLGQTAGTMVGVWFPAYAQGLNLPDYHFHVLTADRRRGGHVLDCTLERARVAIDGSDKLSVTLLKGEAFLHADLASDFSE
jgi:acetolactate decarboxylase